MKKIAEDIEEEEVSSWLDLKKVYSKKILK
jgi:hypothetical protein